MPPRARTWLSQQREIQSVEVDAHIGARLRLRRTTMGLTQAELAGAAGVTQAQLQSYERGTTRVAAARLYRFSRCLSVPVEFFFDGLDPQASEGNSRVAQAVGTDEGSASPPPEGPPASKDTAAVLRAFRRIARPEDRKAMLALLEKLNSGEP